MQNQRDPRIGSRREAASALPLAELAKAPAPAKAAGARSGKTGDVGRSQPGAEVRGARILLEALIEEGVDTIFGYPGGAILHVYDELAHVRDRMKPCAGAARAGRGACGRRVRPLQRARSGGDGDLGPRRHQLASPG